MVRGKRPVSVKCGELVLVRSPGYGRRETWWPALVLDDKVHAGPPLIGTVPPVHQKLVRLLPGETLARVEMREDSMRKLTVVELRKGPEGCNGMADRNNPLHNAFIDAYHTLWLQRIKRLEFEVDQVLAFRWIQGQESYLIRWRLWSSFWDSWEPGEHLTETIRRRARAHFGVNPDAPPPAVRSKLAPASVCDTPHTQPAGPRPNEVIVIDDDSDDDDNNADANNADADNADADNADADMRKPVREGKEEDEVDLNDDDESDFDGVFDVSDNDGSEVLVVEPPRPQQPLLVAAAKQRGKGKSKNSAKQKEKADKGAVAKADDEPKNRPKPKSRRNSDHDVPLPAPLTPKEPAATLIQRGQFKGFVAFSPYEPEKYVPVFYAACGKLLKFLQKHREPDTVYFQDGVELDDVPDYPDVVGAQLTLLDVSTKLKQGLYTDYEQFGDDVRLVFDNCMLYARDGKYFRDDYKQLAVDAMVLKKAFEAKEAHFRNRGELVKVAPPPAARKRPKKPSFRQVQSLLDKLAKTEQEKKQQAQRARELQRQLSRGQRQLASSVQAATRPRKRRKQKQGVMVTPKELEEMASDDDSDDDLVPLSVDQMLHLQQIMAASERDVQDQVLQVLHELQPDVMMENGEVDTDHVLPRTLVRMYQKALDLAPARMDDDVFTLHRKQLEQEQQEQEQQEQERQAQELREQAQLPIQDPFADLSSNPFDQHLDAAAAAPPGPSQLAAQSCARFEQAPLVPADPNPDSDSDSSSEYSSGSQLDRLCRAQPPQLQLPSSVLAPKLTSAWLDAAGSRVGEAV